MGLPNLMTLNIHNWPEIEDTSVQSMERSVLARIYECQLQLSAQDMFITSAGKGEKQDCDLFHRSMLAVIAFGANDLLGTSLVNESMICYLKKKYMLFTRGELIDRLGQKKLTSVRTLRKDIEAIEPFPTILAEALGGNTDW